jgi:hypothetical protein
MKMPKNGPTEERWKREVIGDAFTLKNKDINYYRDKYLTLICSFCALLAANHLWSLYWPIDWSNIRPGIGWLAVATTCVLVAHRRILVIAAGLIFISFRMALAFIYYHRLAHLIVALVLMTPLYFCIRYMQQRQSEYKLADDYTVAELAIDMVVFTVLLFALINTT